MDGRLSLGGIEYDVINAWLDDADKEPLADGLAAEVGRTAAAWYSANMPGSTPDYKAAERIVRGGLLSRGLVAVVEFVVVDGPGVYQADVVVVDLRDRSRPRVVVTYQWHIT